MRRYLSFLHRPNSTAILFLPVFTLFALVLPAHAQTLYEVHLKSQREILADKSGISQYYGGISGMEYIAGDAAQTILRAAQGNRTAGPSTSGNLLAVSDYNPARKTSHLFQMDPDGSIMDSADFFGAKSIESIRWDAAHRVMYYSYETKSATGVCWLSPVTGKIRTIIDVPIPSATTSENRGIEGIALGSKNALWVAYEAGGSTGCGNDMIPFLLYNTKKISKKIPVARNFVYPMNRCQCMADSQTFNGWIGNGISEILCIKNDPDHLLVLERCFNGTKGSVKLFLAAIDWKNRRLEKTLLFDFNDNTTFPEADRNFAPDNLEAMTWGPEENGKQILLVASDNNFSGKQKNQLIELEFEKRDAQK